MISNDIEILLVEDNLADIRLIEEAFKEASINYNITAMQDGEKALNYLKKIDEFENVTTPDIIILDLNLPKINGLEVLQIVKNDSALLSIPIIILTSSQDSQDVQNSYKGHANCYIQKPENLEGFINLAKQIQMFWFSLVIRPNKS